MKDLDLSDLNLPMDYFIDIELRREKVMRELKKIIRCNHKRLFQLDGDYDHPDFFYIQPSYKPSFMKGVRGKPILMFIEEDEHEDEEHEDEEHEEYEDYGEDEEYDREILYHNIILDEQNWENCCELVRRDYLDYFYDYGFHPSNMCFHDEYQKKKKSHNTFLQNVFAQRDASNYLTVHENKRIFDDASNHILSFL